MTPLKRPEYIRISLKDIPDEIIKEYKLRDIAIENSTVHIEANKGMYGLPQAGLLANQLLEKHLNKRGYFQSKLVHSTRIVEIQVETSAVHIGGK